MTASSLQARLQIDPAVVDIQRTLLPSATVIFRGRVVSVDVDPHDPFRFIASFEPDRWYRGRTQTTSPTLSFAYSVLGSPSDWWFRGKTQTAWPTGYPGFLGHDCIPFLPDTYWIVFTTAEEDGMLRLVDDCYGALAVSPRLGADVTPFDVIGQMEADFEAGVEDGEAAARLVSIQRLGNLKLLAARPVLRHALTTSTGNEKPWIILASLRTGDVTVLPLASSVLRTWHLNGGGKVEGLISLELSHLTDPSAVPVLIEILNSAPDSFVKDCALQALGETLRDPGALPAIAAFLGDADRYLNYSALVGMWNITRAPSCKPSSQHSDEELRAMARFCAAWWDSVGKLQTWERQHAPSVLEH